MHFNNGNSSSRDRITENKSVVLLAGAVLDHIHWFRRYVFSGDIFSRENVLVTPAHCAQKYTTYILVFQSLSLHNRLSLPQADLLEL